jgi:hemerythrin
MIEVLMGDIADGWRAQRLPNLRWSEAMSVGVPSLDGDHRCLMRIIRLLEEGTEADVPRMVDTVLDTLLVYGRFHFAREERFMAACGFPGIDVHRGEHAGFADAIARLRERHERRADPGVAAELLHFLTNWLVHHILIQDMAYKPFVRDADRAEASLQAEQRCGLGATLSPSQAPVAAATGIARA